jgi:hypothetical protein
VSPARTSALIAFQSSGATCNILALRANAIFLCPEPPSHLRNAAEGCDDEEKSNVNLAASYDGCRSSHAMTRPALSYDGKTG